MKFERVCNGFYQTIINLKFGKKVKLIIKKDLDSGLWIVERVTWGDFYGSTHAFTKVIERHDTYNQAREDIRENLDFYTGQ